MKRRPEILFRAAAFAAALAVILLFQSGCGVVEEREETLPLAVEGLELPSNYMDGLSVEIERSKQSSAEEYTFIWMTDTQYYSEQNPEIYKTMTRWIADNAEQKNIEFVFHTGDVVNHCEDMEQWKNADEAMRALDGVVPYSILAGNHDFLGTGGTYTAFASFFGPSRFAEQEDIWWYSDGEARAQIVNAGGRDYLMVSLRYNPSAGAKEWVSGILEEHSGMPAILATHDYLNADGTLSETGRMLQEEIVKKHPNLYLVLCGHNHSVARNLLEVDDDGDGEADRTVYQLLADYQGTENGGNGYMRIFTVREKEKILQVQTYSPYLEQFNYFSDDPGRDEFDIDIGDWF